jgi:hypothetical protein
MTDYYRVNGQALSYAEYWRLSPGVFAFCVAALLKLLRCPLPFTFSIPRPEAMDFVAPSEIPVWVRERWEEAVDACRDRGLRLQFCYTVPVLERDREGYAASFLSADGLVAGATVAAATRSKRQAHFACLSRLPAGRYFITSDQGKKMEPHPDDEILRLPGAHPEVVLDRHREEIEQPDRTVLRIDPAEWPRQVLEREQRHVDYHIVRGVYVRMSEGEIERILDRQGRARRYRER